MSGRTLTRAGLVEALHREIGLSRSESAQLVETALEEIAAALVREGRVKIAGFGSFVVRDGAPRVGRNPRTGETVPIGPRRTLFFRPSRELRQRLNAGEDDGA